MRVRLTACDVDLAERRVARPGSTVRLTEAEARLLAYLAAHPHRVIPRAELLEHVWGYRRGVTSRTVDTTLSRLRRKIGDDGDHPRHVVSVYGEGWRFVGLPVPRGPTTSFVGRTRELAAVDAALRRGVRLISLVGAPAIGKSRIAHQVGGSCGAWIADASGARTREDLGAAVAAAMGIELGSDDPLGRIGYVLAHRGPVLVVLDDVDRAVAELEVVVDWMRRAAEAAFLVTSREHPDLPGELRMEVQGLDEADGVALFLERAAPGAVRPDDPAIPELVRRLGGHPLAIELAAARAQDVPPAAALDSASALVRRSEDRHASLDRAIRGSWDALAEDERRMLAALSRFHGGCAPAAARVVAGSDGDPLALVRRGLASVRQGRVHVPEVVRAFAEGTLPDAERVALERRHADLVLEAVTPLVAALDGRDAGVALERLAVERADLVQAWRRTGRPELGLALDAVLAVTGPAAARYEVLDRLVADPIGGAEARLRRALLLRAAGRTPEALVDLEAVATTDEDRARVRIWQGRLDEAEQALAVPADDPVAEGRRLHLLGVARASRGAREAAAEAFAGAAERLRPIPRVRRAALANLAVQLAALERYREAGALLDVLIEEARAAPHPQALASALLSRGALHLDQGDLDAAERSLTAAADLAREHGFGQVEAVALGNLGNVAAERGQADEALRLLGEAVDRVPGAARPSARLSIGRVLQARFRPTEARAAFQAALDEASSLGMTEVVEVARAALGAVAADGGRLAEAERYLQTAPGAVGAVARAHLARARGEPVELPSGPPSCDLRLALAAYRATCNSP